MSSFGDQFDAHRDARSQEKKHVKSENNDQHNFYNEELFLLQENKRVVLVEAIGRVLLGNFSFVLVVENELFGFPIVFVDVGILSNYLRSGQYRGGRGCDGECIRSCRNLWI